MNKKLKINVDNLTPQLDHMVPDPELTASENALIAAELASLTAKLQQLLPDPSLSPLERLERFVRVIDNVDADMTQLESANSKLQKLQSRINNFVPQEGLTTEQKINVLVDLVENKLEKLNLKDAGLNRMIEKLESIGDPRIPS